MYKKPIRIAQIMGKMNSGGVESIVMNYYRNIDKNLIQFDFIVDEDSKNIPYSEIESMGGRVILIPPYQNIISYIRTLKSILKLNGYKVVHSHLNALSIFPLYAAKKSNVPVRIAHSHTSGSKKEGKKNLVKNILRPFSKIYSTHYFCCSELAGRWLFGNRSYSRGSVTLINNAIDIDKFTYNYTIRSDFRRELNISDDTLVIGHVGRFVKVKNHDFLIDIFSEIYKKNKNSLLILVGDGELAEKIENKVKKLNLEQNVKFLGIRSDINKIMQGMDIFLMPSLYEGLPVVGVEAQASGLLCILSDSMTKETKVIESTEFLSIEKSASEWSDFIYNKYKSFKRRDTRKDIIKANFEIKNEAGKLESKYLKLMEIDN